MDNWDANIIWWNKSLLSHIEVLDKPKPIKVLMKEFDYDLDYKSLDFQMQNSSNFIVLEGRADAYHTNDICAH